MRKEGQGRIDDRSRGDRDRSIRHHDRAQANQSHGVPGDVLPGDLLPGDLLYPVICYTVTQYTATQYAAIYYRVTPYGGTAWDTPGRSKLQDDRSRATGTERLAMGQSTQGHGSRAIEPIQESPCNPGAMAISALRQSKRDPQTP